jgi:hypothetical protein
MIANDPLDVAATSAIGYLDAMGQVFGGTMPIQKPQAKPKPKPGPFDDNYVAPTTGSRFGDTDKENK